MRARSVRVVRQSNDARCRARSIASASKPGHNDCLSLRHRGIPRIGSHVNAEHARWQKWTRCESCTSKS